MKFSEVLHDAEEAVTVRRVFGDPYERDGVIVIPAASVMGGGGGGEGEGTGPQGGGTGSGGGFGVRARPIGAYVLKDGRVAWKPALDLNRLLLIVAIATFLGTRTWVKVSRRRARRR
jgi:uncharacterized spore protein YtfJ